MVWERNSSVAVDTRRKKRLFSSPSAVRGSTPKRTTRIPRGFSWKLIGGLTSMLKRSREGWFSKLGGGTSSSSFGGSSPFSHSSRFLYHSSHSSCVYVPLAGMNFALRSTVTFIIALSVTKPAVYLNTRRAGHFSLPKISAMRNLWMAIYLGSAEPKKTPSYGTMSLMTTKDEAPSAANLFSFFFSIWFSTTLSSFLGSATSC